MYMKWLGIIWTVLINIITVFVVFGIIDSLEYNTELQTIATLIIFAYININVSLTTILRSQLQLTIFQTEQNAQIIKSIPESNKDQAFNLDEDAEEAQRNLEKTNTKYYINLIGNSLIWIISIFTLLGNL